MKIQILGTGCPKCVKLAENTQAAIDELGLDAEIEKIENIDEILSFGILMTPGLAVDGKVKSSGKLLSVERIRAILENE